MKTTLYDSSGNKKGQIELPKIFSTPIREDIVLKYFEADKFIQPYSPFARAGLRQAAAGKISHKRHDWKGHYGKGMARIARKTMWRRGTQFYWVAANVPSTRGGRKAHPPKGIGAEKKINKKEIKIAFDSAFAATANPSLIINRYEGIEKFHEAPIVIESLPKKTKQFTQIVEKIFEKYSFLVFKNKEIRAGKGKTRGRKYKSNAGALIIVASDENAKFSGLDIKQVGEIQISDLYPLGRLTIYTQKALHELSQENKK